MNIHISDKIRSEWPQYEFVGKPFTLKNGKTYIRAKHKVWWGGRTHIYSVNDNWFHHDTSISELT